MALALGGRTGGTFIVLLTPADVTGSRSAPTSSDPNTSYLLGLTSDPRAGERWPNRDAVLDSIFDAATGVVRSDGRVVSAAAQPATYTCFVSKQAYEHLGG